MEFNHVIRNIETSIRYKRILVAPALIFEMRAPSFQEIVQYLLVDDLTRPCHAQLATKSQFSNELESIITGTNPRWKLWEGKIYRDRMVLRYLDTQAEKKNVNSGISLTIPYCNGFQAEIRNYQTSDYCRIHFNGDNEKGTCHFGLSYPLDAHHEQQEVYCVVLT